MDVLKFIHKFFVPDLKNETVIMLIIITVCFIIIFMLSTLRHFHHFTYGGLFLLVALVFAMVSFTSTLAQEISTFLFLINVIVGIILIAVDWDDLVEFIHPYDKNFAKYCIYYENCPCGCNYGYCSKKKDWVAKEDEDCCEHFKRANHLRWRLF